MNTADMHERLLKLERSNRRMRWGGGLLLVALAAVFTLGAAKGDRSLDAEELILRDAGGVERIKLAVDGAGPYMRMFDSKGRPRAVLLVHDDQSLFALPGGAKMKSNLLLLNGDEPTMYIQDNSGKARVELSTKGETVRMIMTDPEQKESIILAAAKDGPSVSCFDENRKLRAQLSVFAGQSRFALLDGKQVQRASMHADNGSAAFALADENEIRRAAMLNPTGKGGILGIFGKYGESIWDTSLFPETLRPGPGPRIGTLGAPETPATQGSSNP